MGDLRAAAVSHVHVVLPGGVDDPARPSGGNAYDRRLITGLTELGWTVQEWPVAGDWPEPDEVADSALSAAIAAIPDDSVVLVDGLIASASPEVLVPASTRLRLVVLMHMPLGAAPGDEGRRARTAEREALVAALAVVTTSAWARTWLLAHYSLAGDVVVAEPGVDPAPVSRGTASSSGLLCVAAVIPNKGHDVLIDALATLTDLDWSCVFVGSLERDPTWVMQLQSQVNAAGLDSRVRFAGAHQAEQLAADFAGADVLVHPTRAETYGMVVTEALAHGLPVIASAVGGLPRTLGRASDGHRPGLLVRPDNPDALAAAVRCWLASADLRARLRSRALERRETLTSWQQTSATVSSVLSRAAA